MTALALFEDKGRLRGESIVRGKVDFMAVNSKQHIISCRFTTRLLHLKMISLSLDKESAIPKEDYLSDRRIDMF